MDKMTKSVFGILDSMGLICMKSENRYYCVQKQYDDEWIMILEEIYYDNTLTISYMLIHDIAKVFGEENQEHPTVLGPIKEWFLDKIGLNVDCEVFISTPAHYRGLHDELQPLL
jgi:hypothetical protein